MMRHELPSILFVEDESEVRYELKRFLQRYSSEVITASDGKEGLSLFKSHIPDIVISDIKMPKMNGIDMAKQIKKHSPEQTIIFTTAHSDNSYFLEAIEMQVDGYILKPVDLGLLKRKIADVTKHIKLEKEKKFYESIIDDIAYMQDSMLAVYNEGYNPIFYNKKLLTFLGHETLQDFLKKHESISHIFEKDEACYYPENNHKTDWVEEIKCIPEDKRIISIRGRDRSESNFFLVTLSNKTQNNHTVVTFSKITSIVKKNRQYEHDAYIDELTQIDNRAKFNMQFTNAIQNSKTNKSPLSIVLLDIDDFKQINDKHGHAMGDTVLKMFTGIISNNIRKTDSFFRWGGEEFVLLLSATALENAKEISENLRRSIEAHDFGIGQKLTCSFGVAARNEEDTSESLFERADKALYEAKNSGKNRVCSK